MSKLGHSSLWDDEEILTCNDCENAKGKEHWGVYWLKCKGCRDRMIMSESCKIKRELVAKSLIKYGSISEWKIDPNCGCGKQCKARQYRHDH